MAVRRKEVKGPAPALSTCSGTARQKRRSRNPWGPYPNGRLLGLAFRIIEGKQMTEKDQMTTHQLIDPHADNSFLSPPICYHFAALSFLIFFFFSFLHFKPQRLFLPLLRYLWSASPIAPSAQRVLARATRYVRLAQTFLTLVVDVSSSLLWHL